MAHPFEEWPKKKADRDTALFLFIAAAVGFTLVMQRMGMILVTEAAPHGIVSFEFAWTAERATAMIESWEGNAFFALWVQGFDFAFLIVYSSAIAYGCVMLAQAFQRRGLPGYRIGIGLAWAQWVAAACDAIENIGLLMLLLREPSTFWAVIAGVFAIPKFILIGLGLLYLLAALILVRKPAPQSA